MAINKVVNIEIKTNSDKITTEFENINNSLNKTNVSANQLNSNLGSNDKATNFVNQLAAGVSKLNPAFGSAIQGANGLIVKMWEMAANPVGAVIAALVVAVKFLYEAFDSSVAGGKELKAVFAGLSATVDQIKDAFFAYGRAVINAYQAAYKFITLDFKGAAESMKKANKEAANSYDQLSSAISGTTAKVIYDLTKRQQANDKAAKEFEVVQSKQNALIAKSRETLTDETASIYEKKKALEIVSKAESEVAAKNVKIAKENWDIVAGKAAIMKGEAAKKMKQELRDVEIKYWEAVKENSLTGLRINRQQRQLNNQEAAQAKERLSEQKRLQKEANEQAKKIAKEKYDLDKQQLEENIKNEKLSFEQRRKLVNDDNIITKKDKAKFLKEINDEELKKIEEHNNAILSLQNKYKSDIENLNAKTDKDKLDLQYKRDEEEIKKIVQTEEEKNKLISLLKEKYYLQKKSIDDKNELDSENAFIQSQTKLINNEALGFETRKSLLSDMNNFILNSTAFTEAEKTKMLSENAKIRMSLDEQEYQNKKNLALQSLEVLSQVFQENKGIMLALFLLQKAVAVGDIVRGAAKNIAEQRGATDTANAIAQILPFPANIAKVASNEANFIKGALSTKLSAGIGIASILAQAFGQVKGMSGISSAGGGTSAGISTVPQPNFNIVGNTGVNQIAQTIAGQQPVKAYVVAKEVTTQQELDRNKITATRI